MDISIHKGLEVIEKMRTHITRFSNLVEKSTSEIVPAVVIMKSIAEALKVAGQDEESNRVIKDGERLTDYIYDILEICNIVISDVNELIVAENDYRRQVIKSIEEIKDEVKK